MYEALELRAEYDSRIKTLKECLPESRQNRERSFFSRGNETRFRPGPDFDIKEVRRKLKNLEYKRRKLNNAIQQANFQNQIEFRDESISLNEALETRKALNEQIGERHAQVINAAYQRVIYKEGRDIVEENELTFTESFNDMEKSRRAFRDLNRKLRKASFEILVEFADD
jgi:hypothetical protein